MPTQAENLPPAVQRTIRKVARELADEAGTRAFALRAEAVLARHWPSQPAPPPEPPISNRQLAAKAMGAVWPIIQRPQPPADLGEIGVAILDALDKHRKIDR